MRTTARLLLLLGSALIAFGWWGLCTAAGNRAFDEMDGFIPFFAGLLGMTLAIVGAALWWIARRRAKARPQP